jgi:hypothetical protein
MTPERAFLLACSVDRAQDWAGHEDALLGLSAEGWQALQDHAVLHGFAGLLARNLQWAADRMGISMPIVGPLEAVRRGQLVQHLARKAAARRVCAALEERGIPFIVFKGIVLAEEVYGDLSLRGFRDLDVLVPADRVDGAFATCVELGYRLTQFDHARDYVRAGAHAAGMVHADGSGVDLHWSIAHDMLEPERIARVWAGARPAPPGAFLPGSRLAPEMTLIHLAKHFHSHQYASPKPLVDFFVTARRLGDSIDPGRLARGATELGLLPVLDVAAGLCDRCFIAEILPSPLRARVSTMPARIARKVVDDGLLVNAARRSRIGNWTRFLLAAGGARFALRALAEILVPGRLTLVQFFGRAYAPGMYPRYYWRQLVKVVTLSTK